MNLKNEKLWNEYNDKNNNAYGGTCVNVAKRVMELLEEDSTPLRDGYYPDVHTPHGLICKADNDINAGGITGFMAGAVARMVSECHERGEEFRIIHNGEYKGKGTVNPAIVTIGTE